MENNKLMNNANGELFDIHQEGELAGQPIKPAIAEAFQNALVNFGVKYEEATNRLQWRGGQTLLTRPFDTEEEAEQAFTDAIADLQARIQSFTEALHELRTAKTLKKGAVALHDYERAMYVYWDNQRNLEAFKENPEKYTLHAIAVKKVIREAQAHKKVSWSKLENYWHEKGVYATVHGLTYEQVENALDEYITAKEMSYTVSTKNLKMKVA